MDKPNRIVLLVEDMAMLRELIEFALRSHHFEVVSKGSLAAGLQALADGPYLAVITDLQLGDGLGTELLEAVKAKQPDALRYLMSAAPEPEWHCAHRFFPKRGDARVQERIVMALEGDLPR